MLLTKKATSKKLNLGSGGNPGDGYLAFDVTAVLKPHVQGDGRRLPFTEGAFSDVRAWHVLEHVPREHLIELMNEVWRVLQAGGVLDVEVPLFPCDVAMSDPTHVSFFTSQTFDYFHRGGQFEDHRQLYGIRPWEIIYRERIGHADILRVHLRKVAE